MKFNFKIFSLQHVFLRNRYLRLFMYKEKKRKKNQINCIINYRVADNMSYF